MYRLGVDVGGTFTDLTLFDTDSGGLTFHKVASTPDDPSRAIEIGVAELLDREKISGSDVGYLGHGTTVALNMLLERRAPSIGLLTTKGFRDVLEIARQTRPALYDYSIQRPEPLARRALRLEVEERINAGGDVLTPIVESDVQTAVEKFRDVDAIAICFLHAYRNPDHERRAQEILATCLPGTPVCISSDVLPEFREYERTSTTAVNAYVMPRMRRYLNDFLSRMKKLGVTAQPYIVHSNGGLLPVPVAIDFPVRTCLSGPAAGVVGAAAVAAAAGAPNILTFDVGGTSTDISLVVDGAPLFTSDRDVAGHAVKSPAIDVNAIGAGGGSIARIDDGGVLKVGPKSAGADPGPVCYGLGGTVATLTDANVALGRLNPAGLAGGQMALDVESARAAIETQIAKPLGLSVEEAAHGIVRVAASNIARAIRAVSAARGQSPQEFTLFAYGGAGPLLATDVNLEVDCPQILIPVEPGTMCARGILLSDLSFDFVATELNAADNTGWQKVCGVFERLSEQADGWLKDANVPAAAQRKRYFIEARYKGQGFEIPVEMDGVSTADLPTFIEAFNRCHEQQYGYNLPERGVEIVNCRLTAIGEIERPPFLENKMRESTPPNSPVKRNVYFGENAGWCEATIYDRQDLTHGAAIAGPAIIEEMSATTPVPPGWNARVDAFGNIFLAEMTEANP